jgi:hypothetical protein
MRIIINLLSILLREGKANNQHSKTECSMAIDGIDYDVDFTAQAPHHSQPLALVFSSTLTFVRHPEP